MTAPRTGQRRVGRRTTPGGSRPGPCTPAGGPTRPPGRVPCPIYQTTAFVFEDTDDAANLFALQKYGNDLQPHLQPDRRRVRGAHGQPRGRPRRGGDRSGQSARVPDRSRRWRAPATTSWRRARASTAAPITQLDVTLRRFGVETTFVRGDDPADYAAAITDRTKLVFTEVVANPSGEVADLAGWPTWPTPPACRWCVDATMATPYLCRPIEHGADIVVHSATKFIGGHGTTIGGRRRRGRHASTGATAASRAMTEPVASYGGIRWWDNFGEYGFLTKLRVEQLRDIGRRALARSTRSCCCRASRRCRCGWTSTSPTPSGWPSGWSADARVSWVRYAGLPASPAPRSARAAVPARRRRVRCSPSGSRAAGTAGAAVHRGGASCCSHLANIGDAAHAGDPSGSAPPTSSSSDEQLAAGGVGARPDPASRSASRTSTTSCGTSTRRSLRRPRSSVTTDAARPLQWAADRPARGRRGRARRPRAAAIIAPHADGGHGRAPPPTRRGPATSWPPTCSPRRRLRGLVRQPARRRDPRPARLPVAGRPARYARPGRRVPQARRPAQVARRDAGRRGVHAVAAARPVGRGGGRGGPRPRAWTWSWTGA